VRLSNVGVSDIVMVETPLAPVVAVAVMFAPTKSNVPILPAVPTVTPSSLTVNPTKTPDAAVTLSHTGAEPFQRRI